MERRDCSASAQDAALLVQQELSDVIGTEFRLQWIFGIDPELTGPIRQDHLI